MTQRPPSVIEKTTPSLVQRLIAFSARFGHRPVRFFLVGSVGVVVNTIVLLTLVRGVGMAAPVAGICAALTSTFTNFLLNDAFTWRDRRSPTFRVKVIRLGRYYATTSVGNLVYVGALTLLTHVLHIEVLIANVASIGLGGTLNYLLHNRWTWRHG